MDQKFIQLQLANNKGILLVPLNRAIFSTNGPLDEEGAVTVTVAGAEQGGTVLGFRPKETWLQIAQQLQVIKP